ncbi:MAG TPA: hypothetical protein DEO43_05995 [Halieaceae bacterium]|nr:hypothetical protein [Halieaceae bacterium]
MNDSAGTNHQKGETLTEIPIVDWNDLESNRAKVLEDIRFALSECGFMILANAPGLHDAFQQRAFREVRRFYDSSDEIKASADIAQTPYFRGYSGLYLAPEGQCASIEIYQYSIDQEPVSAHDDENFPLYDRIMKGPNIWPKTDTLPGFQPAVDELCDVYFKLTHMLSELIVESLGEDPAHFRKYFDIDNPYLHASLNHNRSLSVFPEEARQWVMAEYARFDSDPDLVGTHIDGSPFITLLTNDRPGPSWSRPVPKSSSGAMGRSVCSDRLR